MLNLVLASVLSASALFTAPVDTLVLTNGQHIAVRGEIRTLDGKAVFHNRSGSLYSLPLAEIDLDVTQRLADEALTKADEKTKDGKKQEPTALRIRVSDARKQLLLSELEKSRGTPGEINRPRPVPPPSSEARAAGVEVQVTRKDDEWYWRGEARRYEENVRQRQEELTLLIDKEQRLNDNVLGLLSLGYKSQQFSYQVLQLEQVRDQLVYAKLEVTRAERAFDQFRDDARRQGILPGWLH